MPYRLTLQQHLPNLAPSAFQVRYTYRNGNVQTWFVAIAQGPDRDTFVIVVNAPVNLINQQDVLTRTLIAHYPTAPNTVEIAISSVQPPQLTMLTMEETMTDYSVAIKMSQETVDKLSENNFILYGFKAVKTTAKGSPLVWFKYAQFGLTTKISWSQEYEAYTSTSKIIPNGEITASNSYDISLKNTLNVTTPNGTGTVDTTTGTPGAIAISNKTTTQFTCGISQKQPDRNNTPMCAFPLFGGMLDVIAPIEQVLLMFSTVPVNTGTVIEQSYSPGIFIDLTGEPSRSVNFDINQGWTWDKSPWAKSIPAESNLVPLMIQSSPALAERHLIALHQG
jgi:hypothetical protein